MTATIPVNYVPVEYVQNLSVLVGVLMGISFLFLIFFVIISDSHKQKRVFIREKKLTQEFEEWRRDR